MKRKNTKSGWYPWKKDGKPVMRKIYMKGGRAFIKLKLMDVKDVRKLARLYGVKPTKTKSKRIWVMMEVTSEAKQNP